HLIENTEYCCSPLHDKYYKAEGAADNRNCYRCIRSGNRHVNKTVVEKTHNIFMICIVLHRMVQSGGQKHQQHTDDEYLTTGCMRHTTLQIHIDSGKRQQKNKYYRSYPVTDRVAHFFSER